MSQKNTSKTRLELDRQQLGNYLDLTASVMTAPAFG